MKRQAFLKVLCVALLLGLLMPGGGAPQARGEADVQSVGDFVPGVVLVKFLPGVTLAAVDGGVEMGVASLDALVQQHDITAAEPVFAGVGDSAQGLERIYKLSLSKTADVLAVVAAFDADAHVEYAEPNYVYHITQEPTYYLPWSAGESLYVIQGNDSSPTHSGKFKYAWDFTENISGTIEGHPIVAVADGIVRVARNDADGWGYYVVIEHPESDGTPKYSLYGHLQQIESSVQEGQPILRGSLVGKLGKTGGMSNGIAHLHFQFMDAIWEGDTTAPSVPGSFADVDGDGIPQEGEWYESQNTPPAPPPPSPRFVDDPLFKYQWGLHNTSQTGGTEDADIDAPEAWGIITGTNEVMIAVIDTGVDYAHEDLDDDRVRTDIDKDYVNDDDDARDDHGHGTHVAGTIAAETNNDLGVAGVMWQAQILPLKVCDSRGSCAADDIASAIRYAADQGADVINMSLGGSCSQTIADAVNYAYFEKGMVIVAAAGNSGHSIGYPAKFPPVIAVGATDYNDERAYFSSYGDALDVVAPGVDIWSTVPNNGYDSFKGTSMASPHVAGVAGLLLAQRPDLSTGQVREILHQSADDLGEDGFDRYYGYGRVNAFQALQTVTPDEPEPPDQAGPCPGICGASAAVAGEPDGESILSNLRAVRDRFFNQDPGRRWVRIYYEHQFEVAWLLMSDSQLRADALAGFRAFDPVFRAALNSDGTKAGVTLTPELIEAAERALMGVAERGSQDVHDDIAREWEKVDPDRFVGWDVLEVWEQLRLEEQPNRVYLPIVLK